MNLKEFFIRKKISRKEYFLFYILFPVLLFFITFIVGFFSIGILHIFVENVNFLSGFFLVLTTLILFFLIFSILFGGVKVFRGLNKSGWNVLWLFLPLGVVMILEENFFIFLLYPNTLFTGIATLPFLLSGLLLSTPTGKSNG
jgi:uncharacterized membrane protein YhaH (DUF805 family)